MALSYDSVRVLSTFAKEYGVTFPLLSDVGSREIQRLGLLDTDAAERRTREGRPNLEKHQGLPFPGTFILDGAGTVSEKRFEASQRVRPSGLSLLGRVGGHGLMKPAVADEVEVDGVRVAAWLGTARYRPLQILPLQVSIDVPDGFHLYGPAAPPGLTPLDLALGPEGAVQALSSPRPPRVHSSGSSHGNDHPLTYEGGFDIEIPFLIEAGHESLELELNVRLQACSESVCYPPTEIALRLPLAAVDH